MQDSRDEPPDERVLHAVSGDRDALEELLRLESHRTSEAISIQPQWRRDIELEDVMQVTYLEAYLRIGTLAAQTLGGFRAWLARIAENNLRDAIRALQCDKRPDPAQRVTNAPGATSSQTLLARITSDAPSVSSVASEKESLARLQEAIASLPVSYRVVVEAVDLAGESVSEVAARLGRSSGAVHMLRSRALQRLRELIESPA